MVHLPVLPMPRWKVFLCEVWNKRLTSSEPGTKNKEWTWKKFVGNARQLGDYDTQVDKTLRGSLCCRILGIVVIRSCKIREFFKTKDTGIDIWGTG